MVNILEEKGFFLNKLTNTITLCGSIVSLVAAISYGVWFIQDKIIDVERRVAILETKHEALDQKVIEVKNDLGNENSEQSKNIIKLQDEINQNLCRLHDEISKIYFILASRKNKI